MRPGEVIGWLRQFYRHNVDSFVARNLADGINFGQVGDDQAGASPVVPRLVEQRRLVVVEN